MANARGVREGPGPASLARYLLLLGSLAALFLVAFLVASAFSVAILDDPSPWLDRADPATAGLGVGLLIADVVLPVPSSLIMLAHGALFGAVTGAVLSVVGSLGAAALGYGLGRWAGPPTLRLVCSPAEHARADRAVRRWGVLAVAASRPVPLLAETVAVAAGASSLGLGRTLAAALLGATPAAVLYAAAGAYGFGSPGGLVVLALVLAISVVLWAVGRRRLRD